MLSIQSGVMHQLKLCCF